MQPLVLQQAVGKGCPNRSEDVLAVQKRLEEIGVIAGHPPASEMTDFLVEGILAVQRHFMSHPDGRIDVGGRTMNFLSRWQKKPISPGVQLPGRLQEAWDLVDPLLPEGSYCSSGYRSADDQRRILHEFFEKSYRKQIIARYGEKRYDEVSANLLAHEKAVLEMVRGVGQAIAAPGASAHQQGRAIDVGGPSAIDNEQVEIIRLVARVHSGLFSGKVLKERNGCVHFEIVEG